MNNGPAGSWTAAGSNGVLRDGADRGGTLGRRRAKSGPKRVTFNLDTEDGSTGSGVPPALNRPLDDGMPPWWPRPLDPRPGFTGAPEMRRIVISHPSKDAPRLMNTAPTAAPLPAAAVSVSSVPGQVVASSPPGAPLQARPVSSEERTVLRSLGDGQTSASMDLRPNGSSAPPFSLVSSGAEMAPQAQGSWSATSPQTTPQVTSHQPEYYDNVRSDWPAGQVNQSASNAGVLAPQMPLTQVPQYTQQTKAETPTVQQVTVYFRSPETRRAHLAQAQGTSQTLPRSATMSPTPEHGNASPAVSAQVPNQTLPRSLGQTPTHQQQSIPQTSQTYFVIRTSPRPSPPQQRANRTASLEPSPQPGLASPNLNSPRKEYIIKTLNEPDVVLDTQRQLGSTPAGGSEVAEVDATHPKEEDFWQLSPRPARHPPGVTSPPIVDVTGGKPVPPQKPARTESMWSRLLCSPAMDSAVSPAVSGAYPQSSVGSPVISGNSALAASGQSVASTATPVIPVGLSARYKDTLSRQPTGIGVRPASPPTVEDVSTSSTLLSQQWAKLFDTEADQIDARSEFLTKGRQDQREYQSYPKQEVRAQDQQLEDWLQQGKREQERLQQDLLEKQLDEQRLQLEKREQERLEEERRQQAQLEQERQRQKRLEEEREKRERMEQEKRHQEWLEQEKQQQERLEKERKEQERLEQERKYAEWLEEEKRRQKRLEKERIEREQEQRHQELLEQERQRQERKERERLEEEKRQRERQEEERQQQEWLQEQQRQERLEQERRERHEEERRRQERVQQQVRTQIQRQQEQTRQPTVYGAGTWGSRRTPEPTGDYLRIFEHRFTSPTPPSPATSSTTAYPLPSAAEVRPQLGTYTAHPAQSEPPPPPPQPVPKPEPPPPPHSPNPLDDELEICLRSVEEAMASLQSTYNQQRGGSVLPQQAETGAATQRQTLNRSFEVSSSGATNNWRRRSFNEAELEQWNRREAWREKRAAESDHDDDRRRNQTTQDVLSRQLALWQGQSGQGQGQGQRRVAQGQQQPVTRQITYYESEGDDEDLGSRISRIGLESRQKHRSITAGNYQSGWTSGGYRGSISGLQSLAGVIQQPARKLQSPAATLLSSAVGPPASAPQSLSSQPRPRFTPDPDRSSTGLQSVSSRLQSPPYSSSTTYAQSSASGWNQQPPASVVSQTSTTAGLHDPARTSSYTPSGRRSQTPLGSAESWHQTTERSTTWHQNYQGRVPIGGSPVTSWGQDPAGTTPGVTESQRTVPVSFSPGPVPSSQSTDTWPSRLLPPVSHEPRARTLDSEARKTPGDVRSDISKGDVLVGREQQRTEPQEQNRPGDLEQDLLRYVITEDHVTPGSAGQGDVQAKEAAVGGAGTVGEVHSAGGLGFGRKPTLTSYPRQFSGTFSPGSKPTDERRPSESLLPSSPTLSQASTSSTARYASAGATGSREMTAAPGHRYTAPLSPCESVVSIDWNQLFDASSERSSVLDEEMSVCSDRSQMPLTREEVIRWYHRTELPKGVGVDALTGRAAPWFHGLVGRAEAEQRLSPCPPGAYLVRCSQRIWGYTLSYRALQRFKHFLIEVTESGVYRFYGNAHKQFKTLDELLRYHTVQPITARGMEILRFPCTNLLTNTTAQQLVV